MHTSTSVRALRRMTKPPPLSIAFLDALWPFVAALLPHALLWFALYEHPEVADAFESLSYVVLTIGLFVVQLISSVSLQAFATAQVRHMLNLARLEFAILDATTWRALAMGVHFMYNAAAVAMMALAAKLMAAEGHHAPTVTLLMHMDMGTDSSAKAFLLFLTALLSLLYASALSLVHTFSDSNREFCLDLITWMDAIGVIRPRQAPPPVPVGAPPGFPKKSPSSGITSPTSRAHVASVSAPFCDAMACSTATYVPSTTQSSSQRSRTQSPSRADGLPYKSMPPDMTASPPRPMSPNRRSSATTARGGATSPTYHDAPATSSSRQGGGGLPNGSATGSAYGKTVEPDYAKHTAGRTVDRAMTKSGPVQEERFTGALHRHKVWKEVWLTVDDTHVTVQKRKDDHSVVHHSFPLAEVSTSRLPGPEFGFRVTCRGSSIDLRCDSETTVDKWLSVIQWNQLVLSRLRRSRSLPT